jgi:hypothetical protein
VQTVARELVGCDVIPYLAALRSLGNEISDEVSRLCLCSGDVFTAMQQRRELAAVLLALVRNERVRFSSSCCRPQVQTTLIQG